MPIPLIIGSVALATSVFGARKGFTAFDDFKDAKDLGKKADLIYSGAVSELKVARENTQSSLESLGNLKFKLYEESILSFIEVYSKIINVPGKEFECLVEVEGNHQEVISFQEIGMELKDMLNGGVASLGAGGLVGFASYGSVGTFATASTGTIIASLSGMAATDATLAWLGGGTIAAGGLGATVGTAVLGGMIAAPVLAVGGIFLSSKAQEARELAEGNVSQAELASEEIKIAVLKTYAIESRVHELMTISEQVNRYFLPQLAELEALVNTKKWFGKTNFDWNKYADEDKELIIKTATLAKTLFNILEVKLLTTKGELSMKTEEVIDTTKKFLETQNG